MVTEGIHDLGNKLNHICRDKDRNCSEFLIKNNGERDSYRALADYLNASRKNVIRKAIGNSIAVKMSSKVSYPKMIITFKNTNQRIMNQNIGMRLFCITMSMKRLMEIGLLIISMTIIMQ